MSAEQRVTDEVGDVIDQCVLKLANTQMNMSLEEWGEISNALLGVGIAHRATEAKLTAALAEVERLTADADEAIAGLSDARDQYRRASHENHQRATAAESALAATKAKLEAAEKALTTHVLLPRVPTSGLIGIIEREQYPADYLKGVELRTKWPFGVVLAKTETEIAAGQYQRLVDECATLTTKETTDAK